jgi:NAD(P)-dependent dehydrogenase (short-subunit alcohol dehydrogenase family)
MPPQLVAAEQRPEPQQKRGGGGYYSGKHCLVTGGSEGIGFAVAQALVAAGARAVTLVARTQTKLEKAVALLLQDQPGKQKVGGPGRPATAFGQAPLPRRSPLVGYEIADVAQPEQVPSVVRLMPLFA